MESAVCHALANLDPSAVNVGLICELLVWYKSCGGIDAALEKVGTPRSSSRGRDRNLGGAVLVFLPGTVGASAHGLHATIACMHLQLACTRRLHAPAACMRPQLACARSLHAPTGIICARPRSMHVQLACTACMRPHTVALALPVGQKPTTDGTH